MTYLGRQIFGHAGVKGPTLAAIAFVEVIVILFLMTVLYAVTK